MGLLLLVQSGTLASGPDDRIHAEALTPDDAVITAKCLWIFKRVAITREGAETSWMGH